MASSLDRTVLILSGIVVIALLFIIAWYFMPGVFHKPSVNVTGEVLSPPGSGTEPVKVTLWRDGEIVRMPDNPRYTRTTPHEYWPNGTRWFEFDDLPKAYYDIIAENGSYVGWESYDPQNPLPVPVDLTYGPNLTGLCINQYLGRSVHIYYYMIEPEVNSATSIALNNSSVRRIIDMTNWEIVTVYRQHDIDGQKDVYTLHFVEQYLPGHTPPDLKFQYLDVQVNLDERQVVAIRDDKDSRENIG